MAIKITEIIFETSSLKVPSFIYSSLLVDRLQRIKVRVLKNFEEFSIELFIQIHSIDDA